MTPLVPFLGKNRSSFDHFLPEKWDRVGQDRFLGKIWLPFDHFLPKNGHGRYVPENRYDGDRRAA